ncbi:MAG: hypothetical protein HYT12_03080 [Candidatus Liptonbacteria bacterium]|nr:hypothetical protein [Candidatus Liptonbacteria bacterium]
MKANLKDEGFSFTAISGINYPFGSRKYLMRLIKDVTEFDDCKFVVIAGNTIAGREAEKQLKTIIKLRWDKERGKNRGLPSDQRISFEEVKEAATEEFVLEMAHGLDDFLPRIEGVNYHIVIAEKVLDKPIGVQILERLQMLRGGSKGDIRLINDCEAKIPSRMSGVADFRVVVPRKTPWYYRIVTGLMQRLINSFVSRTNSPKPSLILTGGTGVGAYIPFYEGVPCVSIPALHKIDEQLSTENMVGCATVKVSRENGNLKVEPTIYDFRSAVFNERQYLIQDNPSAVEQLVLEALTPSRASFQVVRFRVNESRNLKKQISDKRLEETLDSLKKKKFILFDKKSNSYEINENILGYADVTLADLMKGGRLVKHTLVGCRHIGCLKTLYHTADEDIPKLLFDSEVYIDAGDSIQGIAHDYEYNGENLPIANGFDKQQIISAHLHKKNLMDTFRARAAALPKEEKEKLGVEGFVKKCLIDFRFDLGNHPLWTTRTRNSITLGYFEDLLKYLVLVEILEECYVSGFREIRADMVAKWINEKIIRIGEDNIAEVNGIRFGVKHPHKARTQNKSHRIQDVVDFIYGSFYAFVRKVGEKHPDVPLVYVANFHEAAAVNISKYGRTILGVMVGAYLKDTQFENHKDKVVDIGPVKAEVYFSQDGQIIYSRLRYINRIHPEDQKLVFAKRVTTKMVLELCSWIDEICKLPWR